MRTDQGEKRQGFSETYWNLHRNSLLFSAAWLLVSLPGVCLSPNQTFVFVTGQVWGPLLQIGFGLGAAYSLAAFFLEWRHEALGDFRLEQGRSATRPEQLDRLMELLDRGVENERSARTTIADKLGKTLKLIESTVEALGLKGSESLEIISRHTINEIADAFADAARRIEALGLEMPKLEDLTRHPEIGPTLHSIIRRHEEAFNRSVLSESASEIGSLAAELNRAISEYVDRDSRSADALILFRAQLSDLKGLLKRESAWSTARVWAVGIAIPLSLFVVAMTHAIGSWGWHWLPLPPLTQIVGKPSKCPAPKTMATHSETELAPL